MLRTIVGGVLLLLACAPVARAQKAPPGTVVEGDVGMQLDNAIVRGAPTFWGAVLVAVDGKVVFAKGYGFADRIKTPNGPQHLFDLGGAAQQLTLLAVLRAVADQQLRLEDPLGKFFPEWPADRSRTTLLEVAQHRSGLPAVVPWQGAAAQSLRSAVTFLGKTPLAGVSGGDVRMSPGNANVLALVLETSSQQRFERVLLDRACKAAGMTTAVPLGQRADAKLMTARRTPANERGEPADKAEWNWSHRGARGVLASVFDVHALLGALASGKLLSDELRTHLWRPVTGDDYGVTALPANGEVLVRVHGGTVGYRARWLVQPSTRSWLVILTEDYGATDAVEAALAAVAWQAAAAARGPTAVPAATPGADPATTPAASPETAAWPPAELDRFVGAFRLPRGGGTFRIERTATGVQLLGVGLQASVRALEGRWPPANEDTMRRAEDRGLALLQRVLDDDPTIDQQGFETASVGTAARTELRARIAQHGKPSRVEYVGTNPAGHGETWFRLVDRGGEAFVRAAWNKDREWIRCAIAAEPVPFTVALTWVRADVAMGTTSTGKHVVVTMEGKGDRRRLVFEDATPGADGLLDCPQAPAGG